MLIKKTDFLGSFVDVAKCPNPSLPEYAFIGRSNVGKSSLINMLTGRKSLAKVSSTPGKTRTINHFIINTQWYLVDLPGYGYAKISKSEREKWTKLNTDYILKRENLVCLFVLIDSRIPPQKIDIEFLEWLGVNEIPFVIIFTKVDKISGSQWDKNINEYEEHLFKTWETLPQYIASSSVSNLGKEEILAVIEETNQHVEFN
ncbi:MAG TPA: YihA family ribosome biogenesis GTP-binding protein [Bacteroidales bacterium]|nr:MAG: YihA family ribosome biogenesis GTP-binding protein [Bacteroidetes bacterium GWF2_33_38]OFY73794.1 MAG: YihA family ribosome biogenesis GTP-binding protein [Bacteroidetes bacterium RIFOXYA12_FULL_33_9]OFY88683.1 MAG: YihA family ribosome biogenesis GTP-binding protein [Bacteroidetes bacterium RIFOXYA2_FULL_33_7]HBF89158.1 YihA family ribosome biogenesis GTP-binding protein [Bacteroidales bacterium]